MGSDPCYEKRKSLDIENSLILNANSSYLIGQNKEGLYIRDLYSNIDPIYLQLEKPFMNSIIFHPKYKNVFLSFLLKCPSDIKIYEIIKNENKCIERIIIKGHNKPIKIALFSKNDEKRLVSYSEDNRIKIWSINNSFCIASISVDKEIKNIEYIQDLYYQEGNECIVIYDTNKLKEKSRIKIPVEKFFLISKEPYDKKDPYYYIIYENKMITHYPKGKKSLKIPNKTLDIFYDDNLKIIYLFSDSYLKIFNAQSFKKIFEDKIQYRKIIFMGNQKNDDKICGNILYIDNPFEIYSFQSEEIYNENEKKMNRLTNVKKEFWEKSKPLISFITNLSWSNNIDDILNQDSLNKNYLRDPEIEKIIRKNYEISLKQKKLDVSKEIENFVEEKKNYDSNYKKYLMMLIKDNTKKELILNYLKYLEQLEQYGKIITYKYIETFQNEYDYYKVMFEDEELTKNNLNKKKYSEKVFFLNLLNDIINIDITKYDIDKNYIKIKDEFKIIKTFNQPITFDNKELYWYRNSFVVYYSLEKIIESEEENEIIEFEEEKQKEENEIIEFEEEKQKEKNEIIEFEEEKQKEKNKIIESEDEKKKKSEEEKKIKNKRIEMFDMMKQCISKIIKRGLFHKDYILNNKELLTSLISLIAIPQKDEYCDFNLNLIESKDPSISIDQKIDEYKLALFENNIYYYKNNEGLYDILHLNKDDKNTCIDNFVLKANKKIKLKTSETKNYDEMAKYFKNKINIEKVNEFLSKIFCSNVIKEAFKLLYPDYFLFPFTDENEAKTFIEENLHYIPYKSSKTGGITEKLTLESYYFLQKKKVFFNKNNLNKKEIILIKKIFYNSSAVKTNSHEINHNFYNLLFLHSNGLNTLKTPRKKDIEMSESGKNLERLLFNRCLYRMTLAECIYLLNEKNYSKSLEKFREDFNEIKIEDLTISEEGIFVEFNEFFKIKDYRLLLNEAIMVSSDIGDEKDNNFLKCSFIDDIGDENDVLGFLEFY